MLLHETAHALLHYPNGPDPDLDDFDRGLTSVLEAEACATAYLTAVALGQAPLYNEYCLGIWKGDAEAFGRDSMERVLSVARRMVDRFSGFAEADWRHNALRDIGDSDCCVDSGESNMDVSGGGMKPA